MEWWNDLSVDIHLTWLFPGGASDIPAACFFPFFFLPSGT
jgi:hypothetical protein